MPIIDVTPSGESDIPIDAVVEILQQEFQVEITSSDSFETERQKTLSVARELAAEGTPLRDVTLFLRSISNKEHRLGPGINITVKVDDGTSLHGHIWAKDIYLRCPKATACESWRRVAALLERANIGEIRLIEDA